MAQNTPFAMKNSVFALFEKFLFWKLQILSRTYRVSTAWAGQNTEWVPSNFFLPRKLTNQFYKKDKKFRKFAFFLFYKFSWNFRQISEFGPKKHTKYA